MRILATIFCVVLAAALLWFCDVSIAPLFLDSRIERLGESGLPKIIIEKNGTIYCRMKADDFRFPLPPGSCALNPILTFGAFDTVHGTVEAHFQNSSNNLSPSAYESWLSGRLQEGGFVTSEPIPGGLLIKFEYFGDR